MVLVVVEIYLLVEIYLWEFPTGSIELWRKRRVVMQTASAEEARIPVVGAGAEEVAGIRVTQRRRMRILVAHKVLAVMEEEGAGTMATYQR